jgi:hypothetical protein
MTEPIRVFVGAVHSHRLMFEVLRWSINRHASRPVEVRSIGELTAPGLPVPKKPENRPVTPFSFQRFAVPMLAGWQGRAIYCDSDQVVLRDIAALNDLPMRFGARIMRRAEKGPDGRTGSHASSVMLLRCDKLRAWEPQRIADDLDAGRYDYHALMKLKTVWLKGSMPRHWNALDHHEPATCLLHYTRRSTQPWIARGHPHEGLWFEALYSGLDAGQVSPDAVRFAIENRYVRPSFAWQAERRESDSSKVPAELHDADAAFLAHCSKHQFNNLDGDYRST